MTQSPEEATSIYPTMNLADALKRPEQRASDIWQAATGIMEKHSAQLRQATSADGKERFRVTPEFSPAKDDSYVLSVSMGSRNAKRGYALAAEVNGRRRRYAPGRPLYLLVDAGDNGVIDPQLSLNATVDGLQVLKDTFPTVQDDSILGIIQGIGRTTDEMVKKRDEEAKRHKHKVHVGMTLAAVAATAAATPLTILHIRDQEHVAAARRAVAAVTAFDARNVTIPTPPITSNGNPYPVESVPAFVNDKQIPTLPNQQIGVHPRVTTVQGGYCEIVGQVPPRTTSVRVATDAPNQRVSIQSDSTGLVESCALPLAGVAYSNQPLYRIAIQAVQNS